MIDHLLTFTDEKTARNVLKALGFWDDKGGAWDTSRCRPSVAIILKEAVWNRSDPLNPVLTAPEITAPGWSIVVTLGSASKALRDLPGKVLRMVTDNAKARKSAKFYEYAVKGGSLTEGIATDIDTALVTRDGRGRVTRLARRVSPVWAGTDYPTPAA